LRSVLALLCHRTQAFGETNLYLLEKLLEVGEGHRRIVVVIGEAGPFAPFNLHKAHVRRATGFLLTASSNAHPDTIHVPENTFLARATKAVLAANLSPEGLVAFLACLFSTSDWMQTATLGGRVSGIS
jgi:hypothetical protein